MAPSNDLLDSLLAYSQGGGWWTSLLLLLAIAAIPASIVLPLLSLTERQGRGRTTFAVSLFALGALATAIGVLGWRAGLHSLAEAIVNVTSENRAPLLLVGSSEARTSLIVGLFVAALPLAAAVTISLLGRPTATARMGGLVLGLGIAIGVVAVALYEMEIQQMENALAFVKEQDRTLVTTLAQARAGAILRTVGLFGVGAVVTGVLLCTAGSRPSSQQKPAG
jgi:hypothetical protein